MAVQVDTSPQSAATLRYNGRKIIRTSLGVLWVIAPQATDTVPRLRYSTDDGDTWSTSSTAFAEAINNRDAAWVFCSDGAIYLMYQVTDTSEIRIRKGTLNGAHTDITWSAATTVNAATGQGTFDLAVHEEGGDTIVHIVYADGAAGTLCEYKRSVWPGAFGSVQTLTSWSGVTTPRIDFNHTQADVTAIKDSAPHIYVSWYEDNKIMFRKAVYSSGPTWTWNDARTITSDAFSKNAFAMSFDGTDVVMIVESQGTAEALLVLERNAADTTTTSLANTPTRNGASIAYSDITYNPNRDIEILHADAVAKVLQRVIYDRSGSSWGSWVTIDADADDLYPQVKIGYWSGSKDDAVEVLWMDSGGGSPYDIMSERFTFAAAPVVVTITDSVGVTDQTSRVVDVKRTVTNPVGVTDQTAVAKTVQATVIEAVGISDVVLRVHDAKRTVSDDAGIIDAAASAKAIARTVTDAISITDDTQAVKAIAVTISDDADVTDSISRIAPTVRVVTDAVGLVDAVTQAEENAEASVETVGVTDSTSRVHEVKRTVTDAVGVTDLAIDDLTVPIVETEIRPVSDVSTAGWDTAPTASQPLWEQLDEEIPSDVDYIFAEAP